MQGIFHLSLFRRSHQGFLTLTITYNTWLEPGKGFCFNFVAFVVSPVLYTPRLLFSLGRATAAILGCGSFNYIKLPEKSTQQEKHTMDFQQNEAHTNLDQFWPVTHPVEPLEEDQPVKCPMPHTCAVKDNEEKEEQFFSETLRRKAKHLEVTEHKEMVVGRDHPRRAVRRRHHIRSNRKKTAESSNATLCPFPPSKDMILDKLGHLY